MKLTPCIISYEPDGPFNVGARDIPSSAGILLRDAAGGLALTAFTGVPTPALMQTVLGGLESALADPGKLATKENLQGLADSVKAVMKDEAESKSVPHEVGEFCKAFDQLLKEAGIKQLIVLIDDLDRCLPDTAIETLEAVHLFSAGGGFGRDAVPLTRRMAGAVPLGTGPGDSP